MKSFLSTLLLYVLAATPIAWAETPREVGIGETLRDATMHGLNGPAKNLSEFRGRPLIINVWASWCGPCRAEMASLERLASLDESQYFTLIGISTDDFIENAVAALDQSNATISHFIDSRLVLENMLGASRLPLTVMIDADGRVLAKVYGAKEWDASEARAFVNSAFRDKVSSTSMREERGSLAHTSYQPSLMPPPLPSTVVRRPSSVVRRHAGETAVTRRHPPLLQSPPNLHSISWALAGPETIFATPPFDGFGNIGRQKPTITH